MAGTSFNECDKMQETCGEKIKSQAKGLKTPEEKSENIQQIIETMANLMTQHEAFKNPPSIILADFMVQGVGSFHGSWSWLFHEISPWFSVKKSNVFVLMAARPSLLHLAKSEFCAAYNRYHERATFAPRHLNMSNHKNPLDMMESLGNHLYYTVKGFKQNFSERPHDVKTVLDAFQVYVKEPLQEVEQDKQVLVMIDLDECEREKKDELLDVLAEEFPKLPPWFKVLVTSRPEINVRKKLNSLENIEILLTDENNNEDIKQHLTSHFPNLPEIISSTLAKACAESIFLLAFHHFTGDNVTKAPSIQLWTKREKKDEILDVLAEEFPKLPPWFKVLVTSRPEINVKKKLSSLENIAILLTDENNDEAIKQYLTSHFPNLPGIEIISSTLAACAESRFLLAFHHFTRENVTKAPSIQLWTKSEKRDELFDAFSTKEFPMSPPTSRLLLSTTSVPEFELKHIEFLPYDENNEEDIETLRPDIFTFRHFTGGNIKKVSFMNFVETPKKEKVPAITKTEGQTNFLLKIAKARSLALRFMSENPCCVRAIPYENEDVDIQRKSLAMRLYVHTGGRGIPEHIETAAQEIFSGYPIEFDDLQRRPLGKIVTRLSLNKTKREEREKELSKLSKIIEKNLHVFENRLNVTAVQASYKIVDSIEKDTPCVTVFVLGKGRIPAGETGIVEINELNGYPYDVVEGYYQPASLESYASPLHGGVGIGVKDENGAGTLGGFLKDGEGKRYILSCQHVLRPSTEVSDDIVQPAEDDYKTMLTKAETEVEQCQLEIENLDKIRNKSSVFQKEQLEKKTQKLQENIEEAEKSKGKVEENEPRKIGTYICGLQENVTAIDNNTVFIDAAIAELEEEQSGEIELDKCLQEEINRCSLYGFKNKYDHVVGPNGKIADLADFKEVCGLTFMKIGRTTGLTDSGQIVEKQKIRKMFINCISAPQDERHDLATRSFWAHTCLVIRNDERPFCEKGDSGALVFDNHGRAWGLVFGVFRNLYINFVCCLASPLSEALKALERESGKKLELWKTPEETVIEEESEIVIEI